MRKQAYPNYSEYMPQSAVYDLKKWITAFRDIYVKIHLGINKTAATKEITKEWPEIEKHNFSNWMKYYESGEISKYKTAYYPDNKASDYFMPVDISRLNNETRQIADGMKPGLSKEDIEASNEQVRRSIISRLNSIEKHLGSNQGFLFAGKNYKDLIDSIHRLKAQIHTQGRVSLSAQTCIDLIHKEANILRRKNCEVGSEVMIKLAQQLPGNTGNLDSGAIPAGGSIEGGGSGTQESPMPNLSGPPPELEEPEEDVEAGMKGFLDNLNIGNTDREESEIDDGDEVVMDDDGIEIDSFLINSDDEIIVTSQEVQVPEKKTPKLKQEVVRPRENVPEEVATNSDFETLVNSAFDKLTMEDLLRKLQDISIIFQKKEINNQLAIANLMFAKLNLQPYFTNFSEIQQKQLDATNYSSTRMTDIIATLQGSIGKSRIDLSKQETDQDPEAELLRRHLENEEKKDKERKETRKQVEEQKLNQDISDKQELEVESPAEELAEIQPEQPTIPQRPTVPQQKV